MLTTERVAYDLEGRAKLQCERGDESRIVSPRFDHGSRLRNVEEYFRDGAIFEPANTRDVVKAAVPEIDQFMLAAIWETTTRDHATPPLFAAASAWLKRSISAGMRVSGVVMPLLVGT